MSRGTSQWSWLELLKKSPIGLHSFGARMFAVLGDGAFFVKYFSGINALRKNSVKRGLVFCGAYISELIAGFLFVFPEANLYNAARLAGRVSFKVIFK